MSGNVSANTFTRHRPLGPASLDEVRGRAQAAILFDGSNEVDRVIRRSSPVFLIGRRGSGKTAFLKATVEESDLIVDLSSPELIAQVANTLRALGIQYSGEFTERVVPVWDACFVAALCARLSSKHSSVKPEDAPQAWTFGRRERKASEGYANDAASAFLYEVRQRLRKDPDYQSVQQLLDTTELNGVPLWVTRGELKDAFGRDGTVPRISLDSLDQYTGFLYKSGVLETNQALALQGLFRAASRQGRSPDAVYRIRVSFPAELWHFFKEVSANPLKDFDDAVLLHWNNKELLHVCAVRFLKYLEAEFPERYRSLRPGHGFDAELFYTFLPRKIMSSTGHTEPTITYLLRHTQLLPRHIIQLLNQIFENYDLNNDLVDSAHIRTSVERAEEIILGTILNSYDLVYPELKSVCEAIVPHIPFEFTLKDLQVQINRTNKHGMGTAEIVKMLVEVGVIGRVVERTKLYAKADFEYLHVNRLYVGPEDALCLHPLFAKGFDSPDSRPEGEHARHQLPILPLGSDPTRPGEYGRLIHLSQDDM